MKILVTGANGFLGQHLCHKLTEMGHTVYGLVRTPSKMALAHERFFIIKGDLDCANLDWSNYLPADLDACIHTAGLVHTYNNEDFFKVNTLGTKFLVLSLREKYKEKFNFMLISSLAAGGPVHLGEKRNETDLDFPVSSYGRSKKQAEDMLRDFAPKGWTTSVVRPPMIIGPGDTAVLDIFKMVRDGFILLPGRGARNKEYSFVCVFDLVETITKLLDSNLSLIVYSAHESIIKFQQLIEEIKKQMKRKWIIYLPLPVFIIRIIAFFLKLVHKFFQHNIRLTPDKIYEIEAAAWTCDSSISKTTLHQHYFYDLDKTITVTLADYKKRGWL